MATYKLDGFTDVTHTLTIDPDGFDACGRRRWRYRLLAGDEAIFTGDDLSSPPWTVEDEAARAALSFLTLREHDVEDEYFTRHGYTQAQLDWRDTHAEALSLALCAENGTGVDSLARFRVPADPPR